MLICVPFSLLKDMLHLVERNESSANEYIYGVLCKPDIINAFTHNIITIKRVVNSYRLSWRLSLLCVGYAHKITVTARWHFVARSVFSTSQFFFSLFPHLQACLIMCHIKISYRRTKIILSSMSVLRKCSNSVICLYKAFSHKHI